ncbi:OmpW family protein [Polynucleobacter sp. MWH-UH2A]|uniref:OmpW/AlkL family protein n=1 Tax=Polynucleobacter sp. MWH-UH2A TaxID=1855617 RepID=UPI001BFD8FC7|nr:OmpW family outer membrane protein [Polynucleobacter sp. MWH-UH2A]QWD64827.1 OmpW family protein [Polynucleobacter sp. MWH-UH2A]
MRLKSLVAAMAAVASLAPIAAQAQAQENPWMLRVRAAYLDFQNGQSNNANSQNLGVAAQNIRAQKEWIPEFDITYFFTKNIAAELVLTYPQNVNIYSNLNGQKSGTITALPPSLLAQYHFTDLGAVKPYIGAGVNYTIFGNTGNFGGINNALTVGNSSFGFAGQVGLDYMFDKNWGMNLDVKYITMNTKVNSASTGQNIGTLTLNPWVPAVGVTYKF